MKNFELTFLFIITSIIGFIVESTMISFPFTFLVGAFMLFLFKKIHIYSLVFLNGFVIDSLRIVNFSYTPFFMIATVLLIYLYEKYFGSSDIVVGTLIILAVGLIYSNVMHYSFFQTIVIYALLGIGFIGFNILRKRSIFA